MGCCSSAPVSRPITAEQDSPEQVRLQKLVRQYKLDPAAILHHEFTTLTAFREWYQKSLIGRSGLQALLLTQYDDAWHLNRERLPTEEWNVVWQAMAVNPGLVVLQINGQMLEKPEIDGLINALRYCPNLQMADFFGNQISDRPALVLADACSQMPAMSRLNLGNNALGAAARDVIGERINSDKSISLRVLL